MTLRILLLAGVVFVAIPSSALATPPLTIISPDEASVGAKAPKPVTVAIRNEGASDLTVDVSSVLDEGSATVTPRTATIHGYEVKRLQITITADRKDRDTAGDLILKPANAAPAVLPVTIEPKKSYSWSAFLVICLPFAAAIALVLWAVLAANIKAPLGPANWDYSQSWATTLTVVGALLGTVIGAGVLPDELDLFTKEGYAGLNVFFGLLVLLAPLVYAAAQKRIADATNGTPQYQGTVWAFGLASVSTLWGVLGELCTVALLFRELEKSSSLNTILVWALWVLLGLTVLVILIYAKRRMRLILESPAASEGAGLAPPGAKGTWALL